MRLVQIEARPEAVPEYHIVEGNRRLLLVVNGSLLYDLADENRAVDFAASTRSAPSISTMPEPAALSLNIAQSCNLACGYCYADEGRFGGVAKLMPLATAKDAIDRHIGRARVKNVSVGFIGGEPLMNRPVLHEATRFAADNAVRLGVGLTFGITTNGTLLREDDIALIRSFPFAVNVSMDGACDSHNALRPTKHGTGSFAQALRGVRPLLADPGRSRVAARVTVTRRNMNVGDHVAALAAAGFAEIGVSPMRTGPDAELRIAGADWHELLANMKAAAQADWNRVTQTRASLRFTNFSNALRQLHAGACHALPCGSAASYVSLSAEGRYYTCHRTVGDERFALGELAGGPSAIRRTAFAASRAVDKQEPCRSCWARYLCGGGCHAEVALAGRAGCDFIRGWLEFCISLYPEVLTLRPDLLETKQAAGDMR